MKRVSVGAFGALVVATVAAFFVTQHLKSTNPVIGPNITSPKPFSPGPGGCRQTTFTSFYLLHRADDVDVYVVDSSGTIVRTIVLNHHMRKGVRVPDGAAFTWNGRQDDGSLAPDGTYYFRVGLRNQGRTIDLTGYPILLRTVAPHPRITRIDNALLPQGASGATIHYTGTDGHLATVRVYRTDLNPAKPRLVYSFLTSLRPTATWDGKISGRPAPAGVYLLGLDVTDRVCNTGHFPALIPPTPGSTPHAGVTVRYLAALPPLNAVPAGSSAVVLVDSRQRPYQWALRRVGASRVLGSGGGTGYQLQVRLPRAGAGLYKLTIRSGPYRTEVPVLARAPARPRHGVLVVLPALTWQGQNAVDDDGDGIPDTLDAGGPIQLERVLANGPPGGFSDQAGLLAYLDQARLSYDLTTDIGLINGSGPRLRDYTGVVFAGAERWLPRTLSAALRSYVQGGGRVLSLGIDSLRRGVSVQGGGANTQALSPTPADAADALGARPGSTVTHSSATVLTIRDDLNLFTSTSNAFPGYSSYEPIAAPASATQISSAGVTSSESSIIGYRLGSGLVVEIGLVGFGSSLPRSVGAQELTRRLWTILAH